MKKYSYPSRTIKAVLLLFTVFFTCPSFAQLESFENVSVSCAGNTTYGSPFCNYAYTVSPFYNGCVPNWHAANGNPWVSSMPNSFYGILQHPAADGNYAAIEYFYADAGVTNPNGEARTGSVYYDHTFLAGHTYMLTYSIWVLDLDGDAFEAGGIPGNNYQGYFDVVLTNSLTNSNVEQVPDIPASSQVIQTLSPSTLESIENNSSSGSWVTQTVCFTPTTNYSQLWFRPCVPSFNATDPNWWFDQPNLNILINFTVELDKIQITQTPTIAAQNSTLCSGSSTNVIITEPNGTSITYTDPSGNPHTVVIGSDGENGVYTIPTGTLTNTGTTSVNYTYTVTAPVNCGGTAPSATITVKPTPTASISGPSVLCGGGNITYTITGTPGATVTYNETQGNLSALHSLVIGSGGSTSITEAISSTTTYTLTGVSLNGCTGPVNSQFTVSVNTPPTASLGLNSSTQLCGTGPFSFSFIIIGTPGATVEYTRNGVIEYATIASTGNVLITNSITTTTTFTLVSVSLHGCNTSLSGSVTATVTPIPVFTLAGKDSVCEGSSTILTVSPASSYTYTWSPASGLSATTGSSVVASPSSTTTYTVTATNSNGCSSSQTITLYVLPAPTVTASAANASLCPGQSTILTAYGANTYIWSPAATLSGTTGSQVTATPTAATNDYTVMGIGTNGCSSTAVVNVNVNYPSVTVHATYDTICSGGSTNLTATGHGTFTWTPASTLSSGSGTPVTATPTTTTTYTATANLNGCTTSTPFTVTVLPAPVITIAASGQTYCSGETVQLIASSADPYYNYTWTPATGLTIQSAGHAIAHPPHTSTYTVIGTDNTYGCVTTASITLIANACRLMDNNNSIATVQDGPESYIVSPNPSNGNITITQNITDDNPVSLEITDASGRTVYKAQMQFYNKEIKLSLNNVAVGLYLLHLVNNNGSDFSYKLVIVNESGE